MPRHQLDGVVKVFGLEHEDPAQLLFGLGIGAIGDGHLAVFPSQRGSVPSALERFPTNKVTFFSQHVVVVEALIDHGVALAFGHRSPFVFFHISKAYVFHNFLLILFDWPLHPIVVQESAKSTTAIKKRWARSFNPPIRPAAAPKNAARAPVA